MLVTCEANQVEIASGRMSLIGYFLYMCLAMTLLPLPADPVVIGMGVHFDPLSVALIGALGTITAALVEYSLVHTIVRRARMQRKLLGSKIYRKFKKFAKRRMFLALVVFAATPLPFDPIRIFAALSRYPLGKYTLAIFIGRAPRYYLLAVAGELIQFPLWSLIALCLLFALYGFVGQSADKPQHSPLFKPLFTPLWPRHARTNA